MSPGMSEWVSERIAAFPREASEASAWLAPAVEEYDALPLHEGWWDVIGIRADGEIVSWSTDDEYSGYSGVRPVEDRHQWLSSLVEGSRYYEPLKSLLPPRPAHAVDCHHLDHPLIAEGKVWCPKCCGLGWVDPAGA